MGGGPNDPPPPLGLICYSKLLGRPRVKGDACFKVSYHKDKTF